MRPTTQVRILKTVCCLLSLALSTSLFGQESTAKTSSSDEASSSKVQPWFEPPGTTGIKITTVPRPAAKEAEFAVLRLTVKKYEEFHKSPREFLNKLKVFSQDIRDLASCPEEKPVKPPDSDSVWFVILAHWPASKALCQAYSDWDKPKGEY